MRTRTTTTVGGKESGILTKEKLFERVVVLEIRAKKLADHLDWASSVISNQGQEGKFWKETAQRWMDRYLELQPPTPKKQKGKRS